MKPRNLALTGILTLVLVISSIAEAKSGIDNQPVIVGASARALGMGSAFTAGPAGSDSFYWNPSSLGFLNGMEFSLVGLPFAEHSMDREGAFSVGLNPQQLGISTKKVGNISLASWFDGWGEDQERNRILLLGYGYSFGEEIAAGANIRYHRRSGNINTHLGWSYDLGVQFSRKLTRLGDQIAFGLSLEDLGGRLQRNGQLIQDLPPVVRFGTTFYLDSDTIFSSDLALHNDGQLDWQDRFRAHLGAEKWLFNQRFGIRLGYTAVTNYTRFTEGEWSRGFSLRNDAGQLDYAYVSGGKFDEGSHWIAATLRWGGTLNTSSIAPPQHPSPILMPNPSPYSPNTVNPIGLLNENKIEFRVSERAISPNSDGVKDETTFGFNLPAGITWQLEIRDEYSELVQRNYGTGSPAEALTWNGQSDAGNLVNDGTYTVQFMALDSQGNRYLQREATLEVDTIPANLKIHAEPLLLVSPREGSSDASSSSLLTANIPTVHVQASDLNHIARWELEILESGGNIVNQIKGDDTPPNTIVWNKLDNHQWLADSDIDYHCTMTVYDSAGNRTTRNAPLPLIDITPKELPGKQAPPRQQEPLAEHEPPSQHQALEQGQEEYKVVLTLPGVVFETGAYEINGEYRSALAKVAETILSYPEAQVAVEGHTDSVGDADYNLELSYQRSDAVKNYLVSEFGIPSARLKTTGYGEKRPIADNDVETNRQKNRRVEVVLFAVKAPPDTDAMPEVVELALPSTSVMSQPDTIHQIAFEVKVTPEWTLLVSSFKSRENADLFVENLEILNITDDIKLSEVTVKSEPWYRVTVGRFHERADAAELTHQLRSSQGIEPILISTR